MCVEPYADGTSASARRARPRLPSGCARTSAASACLSGAGGRWCCLLFLLPGTRRWKTQETITAPTLHFPSPVVPEGKIDGGHSRGIQNMARPAMAHYGRIWQQRPAMQGLLQLYYGLIRLAKVYGLWFTRERSKVRSLVRPPLSPCSTPRAGTVHRSRPHSVRFLKTFRDSIRSSWMWRAHFRASFSLLRRAKAQEGPMTVDVSQ
ncbi:hypothetical protein V1293_003448 [Bradyrhizobium sp. AZCC 1693]